jgi:aspartate/methionine/tyrosine aminotransferase
MTDISELTDEDDIAFSARLTAERGVAPVPGSSFYSRPELGRTKVRFAFPKKLETLQEAARRLFARMVIFMTTFAVLYVAATAFGLLTE